MMNNIIKSVFLFTVGATVGSAVTFKLVKNKFKQIAQEEIDSVKEVFSNRTIEDKIDAVISNTDDEAIVANSNLIRENGYTNYSEISKTDQNNTRNDVNIKDIERPYIISPEEFGENYDYEENSLTYYSDGILADDMDELVEDVDNVIGFDSLNRFGEYEDDSVFVRNDRLKCDYEILLDQRKYLDIINKGPDRVADE